ncbi:excisionase [Oryzomicrobium sp.]|uniref:excisionase n=1 Tax=Oryzomicrobium sp. TaxID=1911578 RepID=UPI00342A2A15
MISLKKWAERLDPPPHPNTLRNWTRDGKIIPPPVKIGRAYYVNEKARHISEVLNGSPIPLT